MARITVIGSLGKDPELRFTPSGAAVANFSVAETKRKFNQQTQQWEDAGTTWYNCSVWRQAAENVAESLQKGSRVIVTGDVYQREYEKQDGSKGYSLEIDVDEIGPSLKFATARVERTPGNGNGGGGQSAPAPVAAGASAGWGTGAPAGPGSDEPPF